MHWASFDLQNKTMYNSSRGLLFPHVTGHKSIEVDKFENKTQTPNSLNHFDSVISVSQESIL